MKLTNKIHVFTTVLFIFLLILINMAVYFSFKHIMFETEVEQVRQEAEQVVAGVSDNQNAAASRDLLRAYVPPGGMLHIVLQNSSSDTLVTGGSGQVLPGQDTRYYEESIAEVRWIEGTPHAFAALPVVWTGGEVASLQLTESIQAAAENLALLRIVLFVVSVLAVVPLFISARILSNLVTRPITSLIQTMNHIRQSGRFQQIETPKQTRDELSQMTETFNQMIHQLQTNYERQEQFVSNASHELKTPLTVIESYSSLLKRRGMEDEVLFNESVEAIQSEAERMRGLTRQLLLLARKDEQWNMEWEDYDISQILESMTQAFERAYERRVIFEGFGELNVRTDEQKLKQLLYIFMDNARKYSDAPIEVRAERIEDKAGIRITDDGIGIPAEQLDKVFDRFYQVDEARSSKSEGFGLGLSLAEELSRALGAEIQLESEEGNGTTASIFLPLSQ
ncbi:sensor histidine kinase [Salibacterium halotolerans]|uniref:histidine kinase n=1 Tax=Salibacterium halotolerans TaxID=1884432 RepID=A0A1I5PBK1_9BACI|nr:HAMP domain-containing sensor histidine kinase [Salibacterium halotolerans]SFP30846.1 Signal transduction histidine kinase [Salibacterium halotolerans]